MSGEKKRNEIRLKVNGQFLEREEQKENPPEHKEHRPRMRIQGPSLAELEKMAKREDAWDRMQELRRASQEPHAPQPVLVPEEGGGHQGYEAVRRTWGDSYFRFFRSFSNRPVVRTLLSASGAVAVGLAFGFMVLSVFSQEHFSSTYQAVLQDTVETLTGPTLSGEEEEKRTVNKDLPAEEDSSFAEESQGATVTSNLQLPQLQLFVAQAGVFLSDAPSETAAEPLEKLGLPHLLYADGEKKYLFAAAAPSRDAVLGFASIVKMRGLDVYVKEFAFPSYAGEVAVGKAEGAAESPDLSLFLQTGRELVKKLSERSGTVVSSAQPAISPDEAGEIKEMHRKFLEQSRLMRVPAEWEAYFQGMVNGINQAVAAQEKMAEASAGKKAESADSYAWQVQAGVLGYLENYATWIQLLQKAG